MAKKLYLYKLLKNLEHSPICSSVSDGIFISNRWSILGLDRTVWRGNEIRNFEENNCLKQFEVRQNKFDLFIYNAEKIGINLIKIDFSNELLEEEHENLIHFLRNYDKEDILDFIEEQRYNWGNDVEGVTFIEKGMPLQNKVTLSREGVLTIESSNEDTLQDIISKAPIGVLSGTLIPGFGQMEEREI